MATENVLDATWRRLAKHSTGRWWLCRRSCYTDNFQTTWRALVLVWQLHCHHHHHPGREWHTQWVQHCAAMCSYFSTFITNFYIHFVCMTYYKFVIFSSEKKNNITMSISIHITARYQFALCQVHNKCPDSLSILITDYLNSPETVTASSCPSQWNIIKRIRNWSLIVCSINMY